MPRLRIPVGWEVTDKAGSDSRSAGYEGNSQKPIFQLVNQAGNRFFIHAVSPRIIRVVHQVPAHLPQKRPTGSLWFEDASWASNDVKVHHQANHSVICSSKFQIEVDFKTCIRLQWRVKHSEASEYLPLFADLSGKAYTYDDASGAVHHYVERDSALPYEEEEGTPGHLKYRLRNEFVYGLGETTGEIVKTGKRFILKGRDAVGYNMDTGDPTYKIYPFYVVYNRKSQLWYGIYYNNLSDTVFDMGAENEGVFGAFRSYKANCGPLDYYVILGDGTLPSIITEYATLLSPQPGRSSLTLPPLSQFGYLASSMGLAADRNAQESIIKFADECREEGFPIDGLHLSSGWCQDEATDARNYFVWNHARYPNPKRLGTVLEKDKHIQVIANVKPWLLDAHPLFKEMESVNGFVGGAPDALNDTYRTSPAGHAKALLWSREPGEFDPGSILDFTTTGAQKWWKDKVQDTLLENNVTGLWIDNNEFSGLVDDAERLDGKVNPWSAVGITPDLGKRLGWGERGVPVGNVGRGVLTAGMGRAAYDALLSLRPGERPVIVTRSAVPGIQAYAHGTWSGDNMTTWQHLKRSTALTIAMGLSFGPGLYGHDIGGFEGIHNPSPELLVRWAQQSAWHTRFVLHSNKPISTTFWMYKSLGVEGAEATKILRDVVQWRYRLLPTLYSLYVVHWMRKGWPVIKPTFWYHADDWQTLVLDEQFIFGSHILVAPNMVKGAAEVDVYVPKCSAADKTLCWCELDTGVWHSVGSTEGKWTKMDAPMSRTPTLVREGGILVLGGECKRTVMDGLKSRTALIFPGPNITESDGSFTLIEDDGVSNDHTVKDIYTEIKLSFEVKSGEVAIAAESIRNTYGLPYDIIWFVLPHGDSRRMVSTKEVTRGKQADGREMAGLHIKN